MLLLYSGLKAWAWIIIYDTWRIQYWRRSFCKLRLTTELFYCLTTMLLAACVTCSR